MRPCCLLLRSPGELYARSDLLQHHSVITISRCHNVLTAGSVVNVVC